LKNIYAAEYSVSKYKGLKTAGVVEDNPLTGITKIAEPVTMVCSIVPCTNPTSTVIIKSLYALKTRNCMIFLPHPRTKLCSHYTANLMYDFAVRSGAPHDSIMCVMPDPELTTYIMTHPSIRFILATGGPAMVHASYTAGKPAIGVGAGNCPVLIDETYDLREAIHSVVLGKTFDWGTICASEQSVIVMDQQYQDAKAILTRRGVHILNNQEKAILAKTFMPDGSHINPNIVGKSPHFIAELAGLTIPKDTVALCVEASEVGHTDVFSHEKLSPLLALSKVSNFKEGVTGCRKNTCLHTVIRLNVSTQPFAQSTPLSSTPLHGIK
jgi:acetaldehyde dehydrogenase/alcohol dehydrogenase